MHGQKVDREDVEVAGQWLGEFCANWFSKIYRNQETHLL